MQREDDVDAGALGMIIEALRWYVESLTAFWVSLSHGGLLRLILICCLIYWIFCRRGRWGWHCGCRCGHCGCRCGRCSCGADGDDEDGEAVGAKA
jgi:hypothetical protein